MSAARNTLRATIGLGLLVPGLLVMHTHLEKAEPGIEATVKETPKQIRLWFNERPEVSLSAATVMKADNTPIATVKMAATDDTLSVAGPLTVALQAGTYTVLWRTASADGHAVRGKYSFTLDPAGGAKP
jgi:copper resistance protein C